MSEVNQEVYLPELLNVVVADSYVLATNSPEEFNKIRKTGFGASDSGILMGVNPYETRSSLIEQKCRPYVTAEELAVGDLAAVRMGNELEPLVIDHFNKQFGMQAFKPAAMYNLVKYPWLNVNFDGMMNINGIYIPVEVKTISFFGGKHYHKEKAIRSLLDYKPLVPPSHFPANMAAYINGQAAEYGIPGYYYTQLQQQILAVDAPYGYLTTVFVKDWSYHTFMVPRDNYCITALIEESKIAWEEVQWKKAITPQTAPFTFVIPD